MQFKIYTNLFEIKSNPHLAYAPILYPMLGLYPEDMHDPRSPLANRFSQWISSNEYLSLTSLEDCDCAIFPFEWYSFGNTPDAKNKVLEFARLAGSANKLCILYAYGDEYVELNDAQNLIIFQSNLSRSHLSDLHFCYPAMIEDLIKDNYSKGEFIPFPRRRPFWRKNKPVISFQGLARSSEVRQICIEKISKSQFLHCDFRLMTSYYGGAWDKKINGMNFDKLKKVRQSYVKHIQNSEYVLCVRGYGNYSARFYETLCCGRIPLVIDTDCVFPFEKEIKLRQFIPIIDASQLEYLEEYLLDFDRSHSAIEFQELQILCRSIWENYYSPSAFLKRSIPLALND